MNAYERRRRALQLARKREAEKNGDFRKLTADHICREYEQAAADAYGYHPKVTYSRGWFYIGGFKYQRTEIQKRTEKLKATVHEREICDGKAD